MKILCLIDSLGSGGAQRQLVNLAKGFKERGHDVFFLVYHRDEFYKKDLEGADIEIKYVIEPNYIKRLLKIRRFIRRGKFDSVLSFLEAANFIATVSGFPCRKWKLVVGERSANPNILKSFKLRFYRWFHLFADYVVANSHSNMNMVRSICPLLSKRKSIVVYNMIDFDKWKPLENYTLKNEGKLHLLVAASHRYLKNLNGLIEAVHLLNDGEKAKLKIDWYGDRIEKPYFDSSYIDAKNKIKAYNLESIFSFYKSTEKLYFKMRSADIIGLFSFYEGFPNAIIEGMACGKAILSTKISDIEILNFPIEHLCEADNVQSIASSLRKVIKLTKEELSVIGNENREKATLLFNKENILDHYIEVLS